MRFRARVLSGLVIGALAATAAVVPSTTSGAVAPVAVTRNDGSNSLQVARVTAQAAFPTGAKDVLLARDDLFPDALAASYLAGSLGAPILLTPGANLGADAKLAITNLGADNVRLLGGTAAISNNVKTQLQAAGVNVTRISGDNRYETAVAVASGPGKANVGVLAGKRTAIVASGANYPDALAGGPISYAQKFPTLLTAPDALNAVTKSALDALGIQHVLLLGGTAAISDAVAAQIAAGGRTVQRIAGPDRFATAAGLADFARTGLGWNSEALILATGLDFPDAEVAGPLGGVRKAPIVLVSDALPAPSLGVCTATAPTVTTLLVQGGVANVSAAAVAACKAAGDTVVLTNKAAWLLADQSSTPGPYSPDATFQFNSTGGANSITRLSPGAYEVRFGGQATPGGTVYVTAHGSAGHCKVLSWAVAGPDELVRVNCFNAAGTPTDSPFDVMFQKPVPRAGAGFLGYVWANDANAPSYTPAPAFQYNSTGATNTITRIATGRYEVTLPGLAENGSGMVTAYGPSTVRCMVRAYQPVEIWCFDADGAAADSQFTMTYVHNGGLTPAATRWAYVRSDSSSTSHTPLAIRQANSAGGLITITRSAVGTYQVTIPGQAAVARSHIQVTGTGSSGARCGVTGWGPSGANMVVNVKCWNSAGTALDSTFTTSFLA